MMITQNKIKTVLTFAVMAVALLGSVANADSIFLIPDEANTTTPDTTYGTETEQLAGTLNDPFAYDPDNPTSPIPQTTWEAGKFFHGTTSELATIAYDFDKIYTDIFVDLYGRSDCCTERDDYFDVEFWFAGVLQETVAGSIDGDFHARVTASPGTTADSIRIVETAEVASNFTLAEIRANGISDPNAPSVQAGGDVITWSGREVQLAPTVVNNDSTIPQRTLSYLWSAEPVDGVVFSPSAIIEAPAITITKATLNPSPVKLTLSVDLVGSTSNAENTMTIDVYDDTCEAAKGAAVELDPTDIDTNCVTNLADLAVMAKGWLDDYTLTAPVEKP